MDVNLSGRGVMLEESPVRGTWGPTESCLLISVLEVRAIHLALIYFEHHLEGHHVFIHTDSTAAKLYVSRQEGSRSSALQKEVSKILT